MKEKKSFSDELFYREYKKIRNRFRKYNPNQILVSCIDYLNIPSHNFHDELQKHPWLVLLLIKWIYSDKQLSTYNKNALDKKNFYFILQMMRDLGDKVRMPTEYSHPVLFFRNLAYQQFIYQLDFYKATIARQNILFNETKDNYYNKIFSELTGMDIYSFLEYSLASLTVIENQNNKFTTTTFQLLDKSYNKKLSLNYLSSISIDLNQLSKILANDKRGKNKIYEYYEQTLFLNHPFLKVHDIYICLYKNLLYRNIEHFIYDTIKKHDAEKFLNYFGKSFEQYIDKGLAYTKVNYLTEAELIKKFNLTSKVVDFLIMENDANIFIDAKAVEMVYLGKVTHNPEIISDKLKNTVIKAIEQAIATNKVLKNSDYKFCSNNYLLVITYKELYLGNGTNFYDSIANERIKKIFNQYDATVKIPLENMYFITIYEFEYMIELIVKEKLSFKDIIEKAINDDKESSTMKFDFMQHLQAMGEKLYLPHYINDLNNDIIDKLHMKLTK